MEFGSGSGLFPKMKMMTEGKPMEIKPHYENYGFSKDFERKRLGGIISRTLLDRFTIEDLSDFRERYGYNVSHDDWAMFRAMDLSRSDYFLPGIRYSFGVNGSGRDPRIQVAVNTHKSLLKNAREQDERIRKINMNHKHDRPLPDSLRMLVDKGISNGTLPQGFKLKLPVCEPDNEERCLRTIKMWEDEGHLIIRRQDLFQASMALSFFNAKRLLYNQPPYFLEEVLGSQERAIHSTTWLHCNFRARRFNDSSSSLFFAELSNGLLVTFCCIVNESSGVRGCSICDNGFVHPREGGYLRGGRLEEFEHVCGAAF